MVTVFVKGKVLKKIIKEWLLPPKILEFCRFCMSLYQLRKADSSILSRNRSLKDIHKGERCFILGNAPTIRDIDLKLLKDEHVFVMSTFYNHEDLPVLNKAIFSSVHLCGGSGYDDNLKWMKAIDQGTKSVGRFFFDLQQKQMIEENGLFHDKEVYYLITANIKRSFDLSKATRSYPTNVIQALEIALYMGFSEIYLHSVNLNAICTMGRYDYFFERDKMPYKDPEVSDDGMCRDFLTQITAFHDVCLSFAMVQEFANSHGVEIYYTNQESLLRFLTFKDFNELFPSSAQSRSDQRQISLT